ncbi:hypothetical protein FA10DRAFT_259637 [Acaromyces ingoldii]|uniref:Uncharacterized protein n=1 Tax=Acaromyces ingoldii TaxID=215250 RepID=A0A316YT41_9BASI|nr:hypothetical protein FA10DRAFT_259637 [Acaromyces ingoldii]PWN92459.1 hypothetical protein FA10DRAFT_259637 [Acaromyces ingoldii]
MRAFLLAFCLATAAAMVAAQDPGDLVSSTRANGIIITGSIDEDGDTVGLATLTDANGDPITAVAGGVLTTTTTPLVAATTTTQAQAVSIVKEHSGREPDQIESEKVEDVDAPFAADYRNDEGHQADASFHIQQRRAQPTDQQLHRRQQVQQGAGLRAAYRASVPSEEDVVPLGGGVAASTATGLQTISGYTPPANTQPPTPNNISTGSILSPSQIPGYQADGKGDGTGTTGSNGAISLSSWSSAALISGAVVSFLFI